MSTRVPSSSGVATSNISYGARNIASKDAGRCAWAPGSHPYAAISGVDQALAVSCGSLLGFRTLVLPSNPGGEHLDLSDREATTPCRRDDVHLADDAR